jgi:putative inorganic carbon (HCO3(-)) transporter
MQRTADAVTERVLPGAVILLALSATVSVSTSQSALGLALLGLLVRWIRGVPPARTGLEWCAAALLGWACVSVIFSTDRVQSLVFLRRFYLLSALWIAATVVVTERRRRLVLVALGLGGVGLGLFGVFQLWRHGGAAYLPGSGQLVGRVTLTQGYMTGGGVMMIVGLGLTGFVMAPVSRRTRLLCLGALVVVGLALVLTLTRSAWLGFAAGAGVLVLLTRARWTPLLAVLLAVSILLMPQTIRTRLASSFDPAHRDNAERVAMWKAGWRILWDRPVTGVGDRDLKAIYPRYRGERGRETPGHLHNNLLMFAVIWGVPGFLLAVAFLVTAFVLAWRRWRRLRAAGPRAPPLALGWAQAAVAVWIGFNVAGLFEWNFGDAEVVLLLWLVMGLGLAAGGEEVDGAGTAARRGRAGAEAAQSA